eukprot:TRINITY_DN2001_c0_g1_i2.p2 TRINITY_DN2001_c0_g1~~TRINITY_DN2001_c0_g1_i2.p2  ORF type:complete len:210 (+),score=27.20 TRINITY_DN2001_c0_g1_i2:733-1362(+)
MSPRVGKMGIRRPNKGTVNPRTKSRNSELGSFAGGTAEKPAPLRMPLQPQPIPVSQQGATNFPAADACACPDPSCDDGDGMCPSGVGDTICLSCMRFGCKNVEKHPAAQALVSVVDNAGKVLEGPVATGKAKAWHPDHADFATVVTLRTLLSEIPPGGQLQFELAEGSTTLAHCRLATGTLHSGPYALETFTKSGKSKLYLRLVVVLKS